MTVTDTLPEPDTISDRESELAAQFTAILTRPPSQRKQQRKAAQEKVSGDVFANDKPPPLDTGTGIGHSPSLAQPQAEAETKSDVEDEPTQENTAPPSPDLPSQQASSTKPPHLTNTTLIRTTRRARYRQGVKQAGSWVITMAVTAFITGCVSIMLLGLPTALNPTTWVSLSSVAPVNAISVKTSQEPGVPSPTPRQ